jgi:hypothetical protein
MRSTLTFSARAPRLRYRKFANTVALCSACFLAYFVPSVFARENGAVSCEGGEEMRRAMQDLSLIVCKKIFTLA